MPHQIIGDVKAFRLVSILKLVK